MTELTTPPVGPVMPLDDHAGRLLHLAWYLRNACPCMLDWSVVHGYVLDVHLPDRPTAVVASVVVEGHLAYLLVHNDGDGTPLAYEVGEAELAAKTLLAYHGIPNHDLNTPPWNRALTVVPGP